MLNVNRMLSVWLRFFVSVSGGIAAYNKGVSRVTSYENIDVKTTGLDYSNDVVARAQWFRSKGYWRTAVTELLNSCEIYTMYQLHWITPHYWSYCICVT